MKGVTIFLVVFGHCIQYGNGRGFDFFGDTLFKIIYSFHMPLFALVSGYLFYWSVSSRSPREVIIRQVNNLVLPALSCSLLVHTIIAVFQIYSGSFAGIKPLMLNVYASAKNLWFLWTMLYASIVVVAVRTKLNDSITAYAVTALLLLFVPNKLTPFVLPYFVIGYLWHREGMDKKIHYTKLLCAAIMLIWCVMLMFYDKSSFVYTTGTSLIDYKEKVFRPYQLGIDIFRWLIGLASSAAVITLLNLVKPVNFISAVGTKSLGIYIFSGYANRYLSQYGSGYVINFIEAVIITAVCYALSEAISRVKILNRIFFGGR